MPKKHAMEAVIYKKDVEGSMLTLTQEINGLALFFEHKRQTLLVGFYSQAASDRAIEDAVRLGNKSAHEIAEQSLLALHS